MTNSIVFYSTAQSLTTGEEVREPVCVRMTTGEVVRDDLLATTGCCWSKVLNGDFSCVLLTGNTT